MSGLWEWSNWKGAGSGGDWGIVQIPDGASRSPCPALNALANVGVLPRDGRNITQSQLSAAISRAYSKLSLTRVPPSSSLSSLDSPDHSSTHFNPTRAERPRRSRGAALTTAFRTADLSPTLAIQLGLPFSVLFEGRGKIDLEDISAQGLVQHDGSTCREDLNSPYAEATVSATQGNPSLRLVDLYWPPSLDPDTEYTWQNHAAILAHARRSSRSVNGQFVLSPLQFVFSSGNMALMHTTIGGKLSELRAWLGGSDYNRGIEGFEKGFEPKGRQGWGVVSHRDRVDSTSFLVGSRNTDVSVGRTQSILQAQLFTALVELSCGPLDKQPRTLAHTDEIEAHGGWNAMEGKVAFPRHDD